MSSEGYTSYHFFAASAAARELNAYDELIACISAKMQKRDQSGNPPLLTIPERDAIEEQRLKIIVLMSIYIEGLINLYLTIKLTPEQFESIDRSDVLSKWETFPSLILPGYTMRKGEALFNDLKLLVGHRNAFVHMKPKVTRGEAVVHKGNVPKPIKIHDQISRWDTLPQRLVENLRKHDTGMEGGKFFALSGLTQYQEIRRRTQ